jgi:hypothetical protein
MIKYDVVEGVPNPPVQTSQDSPADGMASGPLCQIFGNMKNVAGLSARLFAMSYAERRCILITSSCS